MKKVLMIAGVLILVSAPLHAYVSSGTLVGGQPLSGSVQGSTTTTDVTDPTATSDGTTLDPAVGLIQVREDRLTCSEPTPAVPEPGTMTIMSIGLLAAAALRKKRAQ
jgi:hypothetical protein